MTLEAVEMVQPDIVRRLQGGAVTMAAEQGDPGAQFNLGAIYLEEPNVEDPVRAYMWWGISAYLGNDLAGSQLEFAAEKMTDAEVAEALSLAHQCVRQKFRQC